MMHTAVVLWIFSAVICVGRGDPHEGHHIEVNHTDVESSDSSFSLVMSANQDFASRLYRRLSGLPESEGKNILCSPVGVSVALAAVSVGARGETHQQLFNALGFSSFNLTQTDVDQAFQALLAKMSHRDVDAGTAVFVDDLFKPQLEFLDVLKQFYSAEGFQVDFSKPTDSTNTINKYVAEKTNGKIPELVQSLDPNTVMYLISYIYYKGMWRTPFDPKLTFQDDFFVDKNNKVPVQMMKMEEEFLRTYHDQETNTSVLLLPFNNSYSMLLLLPDNMTTLENVISPALVTNWVKGMESSQYNIYVPKFSIGTSYKLKDVLTEMGMLDLFSDGADLSGIGEGLLVSEVVHQATLDVDEAGATAAAGTGFDITPLSLHIIPELKFNRPFMVIITEHGANDVLFLGRIVNPNI